MKGVVFPGDRKVEILDFPDPTPEADEVVLEIKASGMCGSDLHFYRAQGQAQSFGLQGDGSPVIAGHEPCGVVAARGSGVSKDLFPDGARVMCHHYKGCGHCQDCRTGWQQLCRDGFKVYGVTDHGAHAPYMKVPASTLVALPEELSFSVGAAVSCGTGTAFGAIQRMNLNACDTLAVFGQGPVGVSAILLASEMGARTIAIDISPERLAIAKDFGADEVLNAKEVDPVEALHDLTGGRGVDLALDCSASPLARAQAVRSTRTWGTICFVGEGGEVTLDVSNDLIRRQLTVIGSWTFSCYGQAECARFLAERGINLERIFTHSFKLEQAVEAYTTFDTQTTGKGVFLF